MIVSLLLITCGLVWLSYETAWLTIRLLAGIPGPVPGIEDTLESIPDIDLEDEAWEREALEVQLVKGEPSDYDEETHKWQRWNAQDWKRALYHEAMLTGKQLRNF